MIEENVFGANGTTLTEVVIPNCVERIEKNAFVYCASLETVVLSKNLKYIGADAFYGCRELKEIILPSSLEYMDKWAFRECTALECIHLSDGKIITGEAYLASLKAKMSICDRKLIFGKCVL